MDPYAAAMVWRLEHMTEADRRAGQETAARLVIRRRWGTATDRGRRLPQGR
jgi:hypothetical protein